MPRSAPLALAALALGVGAARAQSGAADAAVLVAAERAFAADVARLGLKDGFLAHLAEGSILFAEGPVDGRSSTSARPASPALLAWDPAYAEIAAGGDLGWTTGPWTLRPTPSDPVAVAGHYVTFWREEDDGTRRVVLDIGILHPPATPPDAVATRTLPPGPGGEPAALEVSLMEVDRGLADPAGDDPDALRALAAEDLRVYRTGTPPAVGREAAVALAAASGPVVREPVGAGVSRAGGLGYVYGAARRPGAEEETGGYLRIWRRAPDGAWRVALDLVDLPPVGGPAMDHE